MISLSMLKDDNIAFNINFKVLTLDTVLKGLKILKILKLIKFEDALK